MAASAVARGCGTSGDGQAFPVRGFASAADRCCLFRRSDRTRTLAAGCEVCSHRDEAAAVPLALAKAIAFATPCPRVPPRSGPQRARPAPAPPSAGASRPPGRALSSLGLVLPAAPVVLFRTGGARQCLAFFRPNWAVRSLSLAAQGGRVGLGGPHAASAASSRSCAFIHIASARSRPSMTSEYFFCQVSTSPPRPFS